MGAELTEGGPSGSNSIVEEAKRISEVRSEMLKNKTPEQKEEIAVVDSQKDRVKGNVIQKTQEECVDCSIDVQEMILGKLLGYDIQNKYDLRKYCKKEEILPKTIQQLLQKGGFYKGKIDSDIGPATTKAFKEYAKMHKSINNEYVSQVVVLDKLIDKIQKNEAKLNSPRDLERILTKKEIMALQLVQRIERTGKVDKNTFAEYQNFKKDNSIKDVVKVVEKNEELTADQILVLLDSYIIKSSNGFKKAIEYAKLDNKQVQKALKEKGFYNGKIDGHIGRLSLAAYKESRKSKGETLTAKNEENILKMDKEKLAQKKILSKTEVLSVSKKTGYMPKSEIKGMSSLDYVQWDVRNMMKKVPKLPGKVQSSISEASKKYGVDKKIAIAKVCTESSCGSNMTSSVGADGYMQVMPGTLKHIIKLNPSIGDMKDKTVQNIFAGTFYLSRMLGEFNGNIDIASAAYSAGPGRVGKAISKGRNFLVTNETKRHVFMMNVYKKALDKTMV